MLSAILPQPRPFGISTCRHGQNGAGFSDCGYIHIEEQFYISLIRRKGLHGLNLYAIGIGCI